VNTRRRSGERPATVRRLCLDGMHAAPHTSPGPRPEIYTGRVHPGFIHQLAGPMCRSYAARPASNG
jgi:hypothetical protein